MPELEAPQYLADQLTLIQPEGGGHILPTLYYWHPQNVSPSGITGLITETITKVGVAHAFEHSAPHSPNN